MADPLAPCWLEDFIGQKNVVDIVRWEIEAARKAGRRGHFIAHGPTGTGKTTIGHIICMDLNLVLVSLTGAQLENTRDTYAILHRLTRIQEPIFLQLDEADGMTRAASQVLHPVLAENVFDSEDGRRLPLQPITAFLTTNYLSQLSEPIISRCRIQLQFDLYSEEELTQIAINSAHRLTLSITQQAAEFIAEYGLGEPRRVNHLIETAATYCKVTDQTCINVTVVDAVLEKLKLYPRGLTKLEVDILRFLAMQPKFRAGLQTIAGAMFSSPKDIHQRHEPSLARNGLISIQGTGRVLTEKGIAYIESLGNAL